MVRIKASVVIDRPIEEVFAFVIDAEKWPQWMTELVESKKISEGPMGVGTTWSAVIHLLGRRIESTLEVIEYEPNRKYSFKHTSGPIPIEKDEFTFDSVAGGTKVTHAVEAEPGGFFRLAEPLIARMTQRQFEANFGNLKDLLDAQA